MCVEDAARNGVSEWGLNGDFGGVEVALKGARRNLSFEGLNRGLRRVKKRGFGDLDGKNDSFLFFFAPRGADARVFEPFA